MTPLFVVALYVVLIALCVERVGFSRAWWARMLWGIGLAVALAIFTAGVGWSQPSGSLGPQGPYYYRQGGDRPVRIADGGTDARSAPAARYMLGIPCRTCLADSISANWKFTGTLTGGTWSGTSVTASTVTGSSIDKSSIRVRDNQLWIKDDGDTTKRAQFNVAAVTAGATRTYATQDQDGTVPLLEATQSWTGATNTFFGGNVIFDGGAILDHRNTLNTYALTLETADHIGFILFDPAAGTGASTIGVPFGDGSMLLHQNAQPIGDKTLYTTNTISARDDRFSIGDNADTTKKVAWETSGITTGTTRTLTVPNSSGTIALTTSTLSGGVTNGVLYDNITYAKDASWFMKDDADTTKKFQFQASGITTGTTRTYTVPNATTTLAGTSLNNSFTIGQQITASSAGNRCLLLKMAASATASPFVVQNSASSEVFGVGTDGSFTSSGFGQFGSYVLAMDSLIVMSNATDNYLNLYNAGGFQNIIQAGAATGDVVFTTPTVPGRFVVQRDSLNRGGQTASIGTANLSTSPPAGMYQIEYTLASTASAAAGTVTVTFGWTDEAGAATFTSTALTLTASGRLTDNHPKTIYVASGNVTYATTVAGLSGTPAYTLRARLVPLE